MRGLWCDLKSFMLHVMLKCNWIFIHFLLRNFTKKFTLSFSYLLHLLLNTFFSLQILLSNWLIFYARLFHVLTAWFYNCLAVLFLVLFYGCFYFFTLQSNFVAEKKYKPLWESLLEFPGVCCFWWVSFHYQLRIY